MATKVIGLTGPAGSGKSEAADYLTTHFGYRKVKFAGPLKAMLRAYLKETGMDAAEIERRIEGDLKEAPCPYLNNKTPRHAMETLGTEWGRNCMGPDFWIRAWGHVVAGAEGPVVTDDCRFDNEAEAIREAGGEVMRLRPKKARRARSAHVAEKGLHASLVDHEIHNDGTLMDLKVKITDAVYPQVFYTFGPMESS